MARSKCFAVWILSASVLFSLAVRPAHAGKAPPKDPCQAAQQDADLTGGIFHKLDLTKQEWIAVENAGLTVEKDGTCTYTMRMGGGTAQMACQPRFIKKGLEAACRLREKSAAANAQKREADAYDLRRDLQTFRFDPKSYPQRYQAAMRLDLPAKDKAALTDAYEKATVNYLADHVPAMKEGKAPADFKEVVGALGADKARVNKILGYAEAKHEADVKLARDRVDASMRNAALRELEEKKEAERAAIQAKRDEVMECRSRQQSFLADGCRCGAVITASICLQTQKTFGGNCPCPKR
ncbi:MAG: hypothetical protein ABIJ96_10070 [Elusimicrobiota bacterium]